jgi:hypothetical protein
VCTKKSRGGGGRELSKAVRVTVESGRAMSVSECGCEDRAEGRGPDSRAEDLPKLTFPLHERGTLDHTRLVRSIAPSRMAHAVEVHPKGPPSLAYPKLESEGTAVVLLPRARVSTKILHHQTLLPSSHRCCGRRRQRRDVLRLIKLLYADGFKPHGPTRSLSHHTR